MLTIVRRAASGVLLGIVCGAILAAPTPMASEPVYVFGRAGFAAGRVPVAMLAADFNGDGRLDLAVANSADNTVSILLSRSDGSYTPKVDYAVGVGPDGLAVGDFNGDGKLDVAVVNQNCPPNTNCLPGSVSILLGNGDGTFQPRVDYATGPNPQSVAVGDFNKDGKLDLAVTNAISIISSSTNGTVSILLGNGDGTFQTHIDYPAGPAPGAISAADLNGDGKLDLALTNFIPVAVVSSVSVLIGNGDGTFQAPVAYPTANGPLSLTQGDFNQDGKPDLAVATTMGISILLGNGDGTFPSRVDYNAGFGPMSVTAADLNGDGKLDLAVGIASNVPGGGAVSVLLGNGDGTFQPHVEYGTAPLPQALVAADFNGDGKLDVAFLSGSGSGVTIMLGNGDGTFPAPKSYATGNLPSAMATGDFNNDGNLDAAIVNLADNTVSILLGNGDGTFQNHVDYATGTAPVAVAAGDFNGDGKLDLAVANSSDNTVSILLGNGDGTFKPQVISATGNAPFSVSAGDFNGDGKLDLAVANFGDNTVSILLGNGDGTFKQHVDYAAGPGPAATAIGDFNGDGRLDLAIADANSPISFSGPGLVSILLGNGDGTFQPHADYGTGINPISVTSGDFNGDGRPDLALTSNLGSAGLVSVLLGNGDGTFQSSSGYSVEPQAVTVVAADFNGDGKLDLATANQGNNTASILLGNGDGTFQNEVVYGEGNGPSSTIAGDFNGDGAPDLIVANLGDNSISAYLSHAPNFSLSSPATSVTVSPGQAAHYTLKVSPINGFGQAVSFSCAGAPPQALCSVSPSMATPNGSAALMATVTVTTQATSVVVPQVHTNPPASVLGGWKFPFLGTALLGLLVGLALGCRPKWRGRPAPWRFALCGVLLFFLLSITIAMPGCGGGSTATSHHAGTPAGTYALTVTATASASGSAQVNHSLVLTLTVK